MLKKSLGNLRKSLKEMREEDSEILLEEDSEREEVEDLEAEIEKSSATETEEIEKEEEDSEVETEVAIGEETEAEEIEEDLEDQVVLEAQKVMTIMLGAITNHQEEENLWAIALGQKVTEVNGIN